MPAVAVGPIVPPLIGKPTVGGGPTLTIVVGATGREFTATGLRAFWERRGADVPSFFSADALSASVALPVGITATVLGCVALVRCR